MHPASKILIGALMVVVGVYASVAFWEELLLTVKAGIGPLLVLIGAFIVWLESDEWKMKRKQRSGIQKRLETEAEQAVVSEEEDEEDEEEGFTCDECGKTFDTQRGRSIHQAQKHG